jgi:ABC-type dipeptide/oligopeptide/nickel transport system ATPase subunit
MEKQKNQLNKPGLFFLSASDLLAKDDLANFSQEDQVFTIKATWESVPFLSLKDNLSLANKKGQPLEELLAAVNLEPTFLKKSVAELSSLEEVKVQLLQALLLEKNVLLLETLSKRLQTTEIQDLLPLCSHLAKSFHLTIYLMNEDERLAHTPYITKQ